MGFITKTVSRKIKRKPIYVVKLESEFDTAWDVLRNIHIFSTLKKAEKYMENTYKQFENDWLTEHAGLPAEYVLYGDMTDEFGRRYKLYCYKYELNGGLEYGEMTTHSVNIDRFAKERRIRLEQIKNEEEL